MNKQRRRLLRQSFKIAGADKILTVYLIFFLMISLIIWLAEPGIESYADSLWLSFQAATTIGFGEITAVTHIGRIACVILSVYSIAVIAIFTAVITGFFMEAAKKLAQDSAKEFMDELEHLPELSKEELADLSERVKKFRKH
ncbi:MAG: two pore domain potassium channel family protein [Ruminococcus sp.]|nr:two pore domain potassium channel family protein [Ruminococcus sp.]